MRRRWGDWGSPFLQGLILGSPCYLLAYLGYRHFALVPREVHLAYWEGAAVLTTTQSTSIIVGNMCLLGAVLLGFFIAKSK